MPPGIGYGPEVTDQLADKGDSLSSEKPSAEPSAKMAPTMANYIQAANSTPKPLSEDGRTSLLETIPDNAAAVAQLAELSAQERSDLGAKNGGVTGAQALNGHPAGALMGAAMGSMLYRAQGSIQSGEYKEGQDYMAYKKAFSNLGLAEPSGEMYWADGAGFDLTGDHIRVFNAALKDDPYMAPDTFDYTHPLTERTRNQVAAPLANYLLSTTLESGATTDGNLTKSQALLTNALKSGASSMNDVYRRGQQIVKKLGLSKPQLQNYIKSLDIPSAKKDEMLLGAEKLYPVLGEPDA